MNHLKNCYSIVVFLLTVSCSPTQRDCRTTASFMKQVSQFSNYVYVDWESVTERHVWNDMVDWYLDTTEIAPGFPQDIAQQMWSDCRNVKAWVHHASIPVRSIHGLKVNLAIDAFENGFDTVYARFVSQDYYMRLRQDVYDSTIPVLLDSIVSALSQEHDAIQNANDNSYK